MGSMRSTGINILKMNITPMTMTERHRPTAIPGTVGTTAIITRIRTWFLWEQICHLILPAS